MKRKHVKKAVEYIAGFGVGTVVGNVTVATIPLRAGTFSRVFTWVGALAIGGMLGRPIKRYTDDMVDMVCDEFEILEHEPKNYPR